MFKKARLTLTFWYLLIIMTISVVFSLVIYSGINSELSRFEQTAKVRKELELQQDEFFFQIPSPENPDLEMVNAARERLTITLILINLGILGLSGVAGYFLAGRTLRPISEMLEEQNRFVQDSSHELRTPLTSLKTSIEVNLRNKNLTLLEARDLLKSNLEDVNNLQMLSNELIQLAQFQNAKEDVATEQLKLEDVIEQAIHTIYPQAKEKQISIKKNLENFEIEGDKKNITKLFIIFLDNAVKYSPKKSKVLVSSVKEGGNAVITISDNGKGIDKNDLPHIFGRFYRFEKSRAKESAPGYGLGLSIAKNIIEAHRGSVSVDSSQKGTSFIIRIPLKDRIA